MARRVWHTLTGRKKAGFNATVFYNHGAPVLREENEVVLRHETFADVQTRHSATQSKRFTINLGVEDLPSLNSSSKSKSISTEALQDRDSSCSFTDEFSGFLFREYLREENGLRSQVDEGRSKMMKGQTEKEKRLQVRRETLYGKKSNKILPKTEEIHPEFQNLERKSLDKLDQTQVNKLQPAANLKFGSPAIKNLKEIELQKFEKSEEIQCEQENVPPEINTLEQKILTQTIRDNVCNKFQTEKDRKEDLHSNEDPKHNEKLTAKPSMETSSLRSPNIISRLDSVDKLEEKRRMAIQIEAPVSAAVRQALSSGKSLTLDSKVLRKDAPVERETRKHCSSDDMADAWSSFLRRSVSAEGPTVSQTKPRRTFSDKQKMARESLGFRLFRRSRKESSEESESSMSPRSPLSSRFPQLVTTPPVLLEGLEENSAFIDKGIVCNHSKRDQFI